MPKLLADFLREQQEPFALEAYLFERGCSRQCTMHDPSCSHFIKSVLRQFMHDRRVQLGSGGQRVNAASSCTTFFKSCYESDAGGSHWLEGEADADLNLKLRCEEHSKQLSPISVLYQDSSLHYKHNNLKTIEESSNSRSQCKPSVQRRRVAGIQEWRELNPYDEQAIKQQRKQLLMDCTRELIDKYRGEEEEEKREEMMMEVLGGWKWSQDSINESSILHLLHSDFIHEWNTDFERQRLQVLMEIENDILGNVLNDILCIA